MYSLSLLCERLGQRLKAEKLVVTTAESCTGGGISAAITDIAGSSVWFDRSFITYSNEAKMEMINVQQQTLADHGAVSEAVVKEMALGALLKSQANVAISVSGIAGPTGGSANKPVGTVCFAWAFADGEVETTTKYFEGDRREVREQVVMFALLTLYNKLTFQSQN